MRGNYLEVVHNSNVFGWDFSNAMVDHSVSLGPRDAAGGQDLVILVHTQRFPTQVLDRQRLTEAHVKTNPLFSTLVPKCIRVFILCLVNSLVNHFFEVQNSCD